MYYSSDDAPPPELVGRLHDAHCHPTTATDVPGAVEVLKQVNFGSLVAMSTDVEDQAEVEALASSNRERVVPAFGFHPWATHAIALDPALSKHDHYASVFLTPSSSQLHKQILEEILPHLPEPSPLTPLLVELEERLRRWPRAQLGEVGLDKRARVPFPKSFQAAVKNEPNKRLDAPAGGEAKHDKDEDSKRTYLKTRPLSPFTTNMAHQIAVLQAQVDVLARIVTEERRSRAISLHAVAVTAPVEQLLGRWATAFEGLPAEIRVLLHSCGLSWEAWQAIERKNLRVYASISPLLLDPPRPPARLRPTIAPLFACAAQDRILLESDHSDLRRNAGALWAVVRALADGRSWGGDPDGWDALSEAEKIERVVEIMEDNFAQWIG